MAELLVYGFKRTDKCIDVFLEGWTNERMDGHAERWKKFFGVQNGLKCLSRGFNQCIQHLKTNPLVHIPLGYLDQNSNLGS